MPLPEDEALIPAPVPEGTAAASAPPAPPPVDDSRAEEAHSESGQDADDEDSEPLPEFDPRWREEFHGLLYLGRLTHDFEYLGHSFRIRTLSTADLLEVALVVKQYTETLGATRAFNAAIVAASLVSIDNHPLPVPITTKPTDTEFRNRFNWATQNLFPPVMDVLYQEYLVLNATVAKVFDALGEASG